MKPFITLLLLQIFLLPSTPCANAEDSDFGTYFDHPPAPVDSSSSFLVMSYNIRYGTANDGPNRWGFRREALAHQIAEVNPDLIGLQEALRFQLDYLHNMLPGYGEVGVGRDDGDTLGEYSAIFYRESRFEVGSSGTFWLSDTPDVPGSMTWGNLIPRTCSWATLRDEQTGNSCILYNLHLDHESQESRLNSIALLEKKISLLPVGTRAIVTGDFNIPLKNPAFTPLLAVRTNRGSDQESPLLRASWTAVRPDVFPLGTFNGFSGDTTGEKIDHILISPAVKVEWISIPTNPIQGRWLSDHFPVLVKLK
ncbi:endonuclease/exonuclease/phosphatase family protein [bacterium]|nr:endonuclease/exonuclease/phosphatase family protein [bacterium]